MNKEQLIYIADDDRNIRQAIKTFLENEGYRVEDFETGDMVMEAFKKCPCDLMILDVMMPGTDGFEVCRQIREKSIVPTIMLTARDTDMDYATGMSLGSDDYFTKPFSVVALSMRVKAIFLRDMNCSNIFSSEAGRRSRVRNCWKRSGAMRQMWRQERRTIRSAGFAKSWSRPMS